MPRAACPALLLLAGCPTTGADAGRPAATGKTSVASLWYRTVDAGQVRAGQIDGRAVELPQASYEASRAGQKLEFDPSDEHPGGSR